MIVILVRSIQEALNIGHCSSNARSHKAHKFTKSMLNGVKVTLFNSINTNICSLFSRILLSWLQTHECIDTLYMNRHDYITSSSGSTIYNFVLYTLSCISSLKFLFSWQSICTGAWPSGQQVHCLSYEK